LAADGLTSLLAMLAKKILKVNTCTSIGGSNFMQHAALNLLNFIPVTAA